MSAAVPAVPVDAARPAPLVMAILNVTPDSFSDGGALGSAEEAVEQGMLMLAQGADLLDVGGESTRPGAERVSEDEELRRVIPVVSALAARGARVSVDTMRAAVAAEAIRAGAMLVNDVSGGLADPAMTGLIADTGVRYVVMHWRGHSASMQERAQYADVVAEVREELGDRVEVVTRAGVSREQLVVDPGFGFAKTAGHNWSLLRHLPELASLGLPMLVGTSRKGFLGPVGQGEGMAPRPPEQRDGASAATTVLAALAGAWAVRVHDVPSTVDALDVVARTMAAR